MPKKLKSPLKWYGGKTRMVNKLLPLIPKHKAYVEVFAGSAAVFFAKGVSPLEVINDLDSGLVNFYRVLRDPEKLPRFSHLVQLTPYSREEFVFCRETWRKCGNDVEKAYRWFVVMRQSFAAMGKSFGFAATTGRNGAGSVVSGYLGAIERLPEIHERLRRAQIENRDFRDLIETYDRPSTFFYLDPPYVMSTRKNKGYNHEMTDRDHRDLVDALLGLQGKAMLSGYANPLYKPLEEAGWQRHDFKAHCSSVARTRATGLLGAGSCVEAGARTESVWIRA